MTRATLTTAIALLGAVASAQPASPPPPPNDGTRPSSSHAANAYWASGTCRPQDRICDRRRATVLACCRTGREKGARGGWKN